MENSPKKVVFTFRWGLACSNEGLYAPYPYLGVTSGRVPIAFVGSQRKLKLDVLFLNNFPVLRIQRYVPGGGVARVTSLGGIRVEPRGGNKRVWPLEDSQEVTSEWGGDTASRYSQF